MATESGGQASPDQCLLRSLDLHSGFFWANKSRNPMEGTSQDGKGFLPIFSCVLFFLLGGFGLGCGVNFE